MVCRESRAAICVSYVCDVEDCVPCTTVSNLSLEDFDRIVRLPLGEVSISVIDTSQYHTVLAVAYTDENNSMIYASFIWCQAEIIVTSAVVIGGTYIPDRDLVHRVAQAAIVAQLRFP